MNSDFPGFYRKGDCILLHKRLYIEQILPLLFSYAYFTITEYILLKKDLIGEGNRSIFWLILKIKVFSMNC